MKTASSPLRNAFSLIRNQRETALIAAAALVLLALTGFSFWLTDRGFHDAEIAERLNRFNAKLTDFAQMLRTVESSQRGYLITDSPDFLQQYNELSGQLLPLARQLQAEAPKELIAAKRLPAIFGPLSKKLEEMAETISLAKSGQRDRAIERVKGGFGRDLTDFIEAEVVSIEADGNALTRNNGETIRRLQTVNLFIEGIGVILALSFSFLALALLHRSNKAIRKAQTALSQANVELEDIVANRTADLKRANEEIQRFAYIVSHDLRSPLVNIMGFTSELEALRDELFERVKQASEPASIESLNKDFDEAFGFIKSSITRMDRLIAAILRISREGNRPLTPELVETQALVETLLSGVAHQLREKHVKVKLGSLPPIVTDRLALEQIFGNLIDNALKFLKAGNEGGIEIDGKSRGNEIVYTVADNGRGIDPKDHKRIFELFRRSGAQNVPGEGMGLAYVSAIVRRLGGSIMVESELGQGTTFTLTLPRTLARENRAVA